tara:strand:+ start:3061 stop:3621 length:561 start_codon:yes stop_codon:yes gene_type:complete
MTFQSIVKRIEEMRKRGNGRGIMRNCGECGKFGHDRRSCPILLDKDIQSLQTDDTNTSINTEIIRYIEDSVKARYRRNNPNPTPYISGYANGYTNGYGGNRGIGLKMLSNSEESYTDNNCSVCLDDVSKDSMIMFQCGHGCCHKCATEIIKTTHKCHMCRSQVSELRICKEIPVDIFNELNTVLKF